MLRGEGAAGQAGQIRASGGFAAQGAALARSTLLGPRRPTGPLPEPQAGLARRPRGCTSPVWPVQQVRRPHLGSSLPGRAAATALSVQSSRETEAGRVRGAPKVTRGVGQGGPGRGAVWAVPGRPRQAFCSPRTAPPLCVRAAALPSWACEPARTAWRSFLWTWTQLGAVGVGPGGRSAWGGSIVSPQLPVGRTRDCWGRWPRPRPLGA